MGSHDCRVSAAINLKAGVTEKDVKRVLEDYLKEKGRSYEALKQDGSIVIENGQLYLSIDVYGYGGYQDDGFDALVAGLCTIVEGRDYVEFHDFDTGDSEELCTPFFIGATEEDRELAKVDYGLMLMDEYVAPVVGKEAFESIANSVLTAANAALGVNVSHCGLDAELPGKQDSVPPETGKDAAVLFMQELLDSVDSLTELADIHGARTLADLVYLQQAILKGGFIDHYPGESKVLEVVKELPSHQRWVGFIELAKD